MRKCGTVKGFHLQTGKFKEDKYVVCIKGKIIDYYFNIKKKIKINRKKLSDKKIEILYIPKNFAHGFQTLTDNVILLYFHTNYYSKNHEIGINPLDKKLKIIWPIKKKLFPKKIRILKSLMNCLNCKSKDLKKILDLGKSPISNLLLKENKKTAEYNLSIVFCKKCNLVQQKEIVNEKKKFFQ